jgi:hypothetical protein
LGVFALAAYATELLAILRNIRDGSLSHLYTEA